ncbi:MAG: cyclopropane-fatty-acyl-phospholipid synthase [Chloroflexi bacterium RBG_13_46_14]|nr:MAG: cyclopropane-fatty-acyl-phospholipid synthase [Chloroflexi bacterium RBG_13_46_14]
MGVTIINIEDILKTVHEYSRKPSLFEPGEETFWDDDYISIGMLQAHLSQEHEAASRKTEAIDAQVEHLTFTGILKEGDRVLDLGCGPGLYASQLCRKGLIVTGVDISRRSIEYAIKYAVGNGLDIDYRLADFFSVDFSGEFDAVMQIYGELNTFSDEKRDMFLALMHKALKPEGLFIFDVTTRELRNKEGAGNRWYLFDGGFWRPGKHLFLEEGFDYPDDDVWLDQYIIVDEKKVTVYRNWFRDYSLKTIRDVLEKAGFSILQIWNDLDGTPCEEGGDWLAVVAKKV